jgi:CrcB protein
MLRDRVQLCAIFLGGAIGSGLRELVAALLPAHAAQFPWATFAVNVVGCLLLGYLLTRLQERLPVSAYRRSLLGTGLCGALTTFSAFELELLQELDHGADAIAILYCAGSVGAGFLGLAIGTAVVRRARLMW